MIFKFELPNSGENIEVEAVRKRVKYLRLRVLAGGETRLSVPWHTSLAQAREFALKNAAWLEATLDKVRSRAASSNLNTARYLGVEFELVINPNLKEIKIEEISNLNCDGALPKIFTPSREDLRAFLDERARKTLNAYLEELAPLVPREVRRVSFKRMKTRWGSCNTKKAYINLNLNLIAKPPAFARYVVLHELAHLLYPHHQKSFYDFIAAHMPNYREIIKLGRI